MRNVFNGNDDILSSIYKILGYDASKKPLRRSVTKDIYLSTFFYMYNRFGAPKNFDTCKESGRWLFNVKDFKILVCLDSNIVEFAVFGKYGGVTFDSPYVIKYNREYLKKIDCMIPIGEESNEKQLLITNDLFAKFCVENSITDDITECEFSKMYANKWFDYVMHYNDSVLGVCYVDVGKKYGNIYRNSYTKRALRTFEQFLNNMLTPIYIRDCAFNIKGQMTDEDAKYYNRFANNIKIEFV